MEFQGTSVENAIYSFFVNKNNIMRKCSELPEIEKGMKWLK